MKYVDGFVHDHALWILMGIIYLLLALLVWVLVAGYWRKLFRETHAPCPPVIVILPVGRSNTVRNH